MAKKAKRKKQSTALVRRGPAEVVTTGPMGVFERLARDKSIDVGKLNGLISMQERIMVMQAKTEFTQAFAALANDLPIITKKGIIRTKAGGIQSRYAKLEDIQAVVKPILQRHGFTIRHRTEWPAPNRVHVVGVLAHVGGHSEESSFEAPMDRSDYRSDIQSLGSTVSYGRRYTTIDLLNLEQRGVDDDGQKGQRTKPAEGKPDVIEGSTVHEVKTTAPPPAVHHAHEQEPITEGMVKRLHVIASDAGRPSKEVKEWLWVRFGYSSSKLIKRNDYETICAAIEAPGPLAPAGKLL